MGSGTGLNLTDANIDQISHGLSQNEAALFSFGGFPVIWNRPTFFRLFLPKKLEEMWILLNSNFLYNFSAKNVGRKVVYDVARQNQLAVQVFEGEKSSSIFSIDFRGVYICSNFNTVKISSN